MNIITKSFCLVFSFILIISCQSNTSKPAIVDPDLKVEKKSLDSSFIETPIYKPGDVDVLPKYHGGIEKFYMLLQKNYVISQEANKDEVMGRAVFASMIIEKDGSLSDIKILRDFGYGSGAELMRVLKLSPKWIPAIKGGKRVRCLYNVPYYIQ